MSGAGATGWRIVVDDLSGEAIQALLRRHAAGMLENSPPDACHFLDLDGLRHPSITFWSAWDDAGLAGCGAVREIDPTHGEIKSMRTADDHLGLGVGRRVLRHIVAEARTRGYARLSLETGSSPAFDAARHLYESEGFERCGPFDVYAGDGVDTDFSRFYTLAL
jgi:putative acetyltransferase